MQCNPELANTYISHLVLYWALRDMTMAHLILINFEFKTPIYIAISWQLILQTQNFLFLNTLMNSNH